MDITRKGDRNQGRPGDRQQQQIVTHDERKRGMRGFALLEDEDDVYNDVGKGGEYQMEMYEPEEDEDDFDDVAKPSSAIGDLQKNLSNFVDKPKAEKQKTKDGRDVLAGFTLLSLDSDTASPFQKRWPGPRPPTT